MDLDNLLTKWNHATAALPFGVQRVFHDVLTLVKDEKKSNLVYGQDYGDGGSGVCLVNAADNLLVTGGGRGIPMATFGELVGLYDAINSEFRSKDINTNGHVSPLAAEILLHHFAPFKDAPTVSEESPTEAFAEGVPYVEPDDEVMAQALIEMLSSEAPVEPTVLPFDEHPEAKQEREVWDHWHAQESNADVQS